MKQNLTTGNPYRNTHPYEDPQDIPEKYADIVEELRTKAQDIRLTHIQKGDSNRRKTSGNAAAVKLELATGKVYNREATSKKAPLNIPGEEDGPKQFFEPQLDRARGCFNEADAEYKLFNALAEDLEIDDVSLDVEGILYLYTERDMCSGCNVTCDEFKMRFRNIQVLVEYNHLDPRDKR
ncbi:deaminase domain-containing protein [Microcoleus sp. Pol12A5]|uniref:deaminase domain-containing protein n=1 Tax=Microcoleus sp. Pol12A5 TaxID=3055392 RepID=UPI002FD3D30C